ncbi:MAG: 50S ribosomal protein L15 [Planctomycetota bacterium]|nr:MAG: 50S ribosomal protein L15 [Planctomycetota bacterium]
MNLQDVKAPGTAHRRKRRVGRGPGSGWGCTAGRGNKGQGQRAGSGGKPAFEGGQMPLARRLPKRGFTNALFKTVYAIVNVSDLEKAFPEGGAIDLTAVKSKNLVKKKASTLKILGKGELKVAMQVKADRVSETARQKIEAAGGSVELSS